VVRLSVNGVVRDIDADASGRSLLEVLREDLGLTGAKYGCGEGECGACTVLRGDTAVRACGVDIAELDGAAITTIEGLAGGMRLHPVQEAFVACRALQCGYCTPGMVMSAVALLRTDTARDDAAIRAAMAGNICRCGGYQNVVRAVVAASDGQSDGIGGAIDAAAVDTAEAVPATSVWTAILRLDDPARPPLGWGFSTPGGARITIDDRGHVVGYCGKVDAGQGNRVALCRLVAAELGVPLSAVRMQMGDTETTPYDLGTFGSLSTPDAGQALRLAAAAIRVALAEAAASAWGVAVDAVRATGGEVRERDGARRMPYAELVAAGPRTIRVDPGARLAPAPPGVAELSEEASREVLVAAVTGTKRFPSDITVPGMWHGALLRPPAHGAVLESLDAAAIRDLADVTLVHDGDFVAVAAPTPHAARAALALLRPVWRTTPQPAQADLNRYLRDNPAAINPDREDPGRDIGDVDKAAANADYVMQAEYTAAYIAHVPLETRVALAVVGDADATVWVGTQRPFAVRAAVAAALGLHEGQVRVVVPDFGGGFGGKHSPDVAIQAARLARASGRPVRVAWTRAEELSWAYLRPAAVIDVRASATRDGTLTGWELTNINAGGAGLTSPYATESVRERFQPARSPLPQGSYRALAATVNNFARESYLDEVAAALGMDPVELRLRHLTDPRLADVLTRVAEHVDWANRRTGLAGGEPTDGVRRGLGIACGVEKGGRVATAAEVTLDPDGTVRVTRLITAIDCGPVIDPSGLRNQVVGATVMGLGGALFEAVRFDHGRINSTSLSGYRVPRFTDVPEIEVLIVDRPDVAAAGAGEAPIITVAPAIANAIFAATGQRLRTMPLIPEGHLPTQPPLGH
jgi:isoquinoline 1-oxidoreductase